MLHLSARHALLTAAVFLLCALSAPLRDVAAGVLLVADNSAFGDRGRWLPAPDRDIKPRADGRLDRTGRSDLPDIVMRYPVFGVPAVDRDIELWTWRMAEIFEFDFAGAGSRAAGDGTDGQEAAGAWLSAAYTTVSPSPKVVSVVFDVWLCPGTTTLSQDVLTLNYSLVTGQRLHLVDIFEDAETALRLLSDCSRTALARLWNRGRVDAAFLSGTEPELENFENLALTPDGVRVYFQPYQVSSFAGSQQVDIPLEDLMPAAPLLALWGRDD